MDELLSTTPALEVPEVPTKPENEAPAADESNLEIQDDAGTEPAEDLEEVDFGGTKYKVPKELVPIIAKAENLEAGVTRRFQEASELRKAAEAQIAEIGKERQINSEITKELSQLEAVDSRLAQFQNVNWPQWQAQNQQAANAAMGEFLQLQTAQQQLMRNVETRKAEVSAIMEQRAATHISQAIEALNKPDPEKGWAGKFDVTTRDSLTKFGKEIGYSDSELANTTHPLMIKTLNLAKIGYEALKKQRASVSALKTQAAPVPQVSSGKSKSTVDPDKLSDAEWMKWRTAQVRKNGG